MATKMKGDVLFSGKVSWTLNENASKALDVVIPAWFGVGNDTEQVVVSILNGSATVDLSVYFGNMRKQTTPAGSIVGVPTGAANDYFTTAAGHGLTVGQAVTPSSGNANTSLTAGVVYYVLIGTNPTTRFQLSLARGGAAVDVTDTTHDATIELAEEFYVTSGPHTVLKFAAEVVTVPATPVAGLNEIVHEGWPNPPKKGRILFCKLVTATAAAFSAFVEVRRA